MVGSVAYQLAKNRRITGFGAHHPRRHYGNGVVRRAIGAVSRPALHYIAEKVANMITGEGHRRRIVHRRRTVRSAGSYKYSGAGRRPVRRLRTVRRVTTTRRVAVRRPRATLLRRRTVRRVLF